MKNVIKILVAVVALCLPLILASCDTTMLDKLTSGKSLMELAMEGYEEKATKGENVTLNYVVTNEDGSEKAIEIEFVFCGGRVDAGDTLNNENFSLSPKKSGFDFEGWYTAPDMGGYQVADSLGNLVNESVLAKCECHECDGISCVKLYAGFTKCEAESILKAPIEAKYGCSLAEEEE